MKKEDRITPNFRRKEFSCQCGCGKDDIEIGFVQYLQTIRNVVGFPIRIISGVRCPKQNQKVGGHPNSYHIQGIAADLDVTDSCARYAIVQAAIAMGCTRLGIYNNHIHIDIGKTHQRVIWIG